MRAAGQNLKRLLKKRGWGRRLGPTGEALVLFSLDLLFLRQASKKQIFCLLALFRLLLVCTLVREKTFFNRLSRYIWRSTLVVDCRMFIRQPCKLLAVSRPSTEKHSYMRTKSVVNAYEM